MSPSAAKKAASDIPNDKLIRLYDRMVAIRLFEERVNDLYTRALMPGLAHLYIGEEAIAVGVCEALKNNDYITSTHRGHGHCLAKGASPDLMFAELLGKEAGYCKGKGGSMHIADPATGNLGANAIVGGSAGIATGAAFASKYLKTGQVAVCFFGEGALGQGLLYEELNLAQLWMLPVIFVCENNLYMEYTPISAVTAVEHPAADRASAYGLPSIVVDGNDADAMYQVASEALSKARAGGGPSLIEAMTYRHSGHSRADPAKYRPEGELEKWLLRDPVITYRERLLKHGFNEPTLKDIEAEAMKKVDAATATAKASPLPSVDDIEKNVWADGGAAWRN